MRHTTTSWNVEDRLLGDTDIPLNKQGIEEAHKLNDEGHKINPDVVISSPLSRATKTAEIVTGKKPLLEPLAKERDNGEFTGLKGSEVTKIFPYAKKLIFPKSNLHLGNRQGETFEDVRKRARQVLTKIRKKYQGKTVLLVTHADFLMMLNAEILGLETKKALGVYFPRGSIRKYEI